MVSNMARVLLNDLPPGGVPTERLPPGATVPYGSQLQEINPGGKPGSLLTAGADAQSESPHNSFLAAHATEPWRSSAPEPIARQFFVDLILSGRDEGVPNGLTLEQAVECLVRTSITLRARSLEIPQCGPRANRRLAWQSDRLL